MILSSVLNKLKSVFLYVLVACQFEVAQGASCEKITPPIFESIQYRASVDILDKHLSGILLFKAQDDSSIRVVMINEMGTTFFDISFFSDHYTYHATLNQLKKKAVKLTLAKDLGMILARGIYSNQAAKKLADGQLELKLKRKGTVRYTTSQDCSQFVQIENYGKHKKIVTTTSLYETNQTMPDKIEVNHHTVNFSIKLTRIYAVE